MPVMLYWRWRAGRCERPARAGALHSRPHDPGRTGARTMPSQSTPASAFSYVRFSARRQEAGDSIRRQVNATRDWAERHKAHLDESLQIDRGVSAFKGRNRDIGALGEFLRQVESGRVAPGSFLVVE